MCTNSVNNILVKADNIIDYCPVLSTVSNLVNVIQKAIFLLVDAMFSDIKKNHYYSHLDDKSFLRCFVLLIPILGNITIKIMDHMEKTYLLNALNKVKDGIITDEDFLNLLNNTSYRLLGDEDLKNFLVNVYGPPPLDFKNLGSRAIIQNIKDQITSDNSSKKDQNLSSFTNY